jgi:FtsP/CotA-like multicopper oxidase with cupredoxin domain
MHVASWKEKLALTAQKNRQEIVRAKLNRREMMRLGLLTAGGTLVVKQGLSARWGQALADDGSINAVQGVDGPPSPPSTPWVQPMPILPVKVSVDPNTMTAGPNGTNGVPTKIVPPDGTSIIDGATKRVPQQFFSATNANGQVSFGPGISGSFIPQKFYQLDMKPAQQTFNPAYQPTTIWGFDGQVPGPLIRATYGEPVLVRFQNNLPSVKVPQAFGIAEITTHLHNGHTPFESDGNPVDFFNSSADTGPIDPTTKLPVNPLGFRDQHYPNVYAGYTKLGNAAGNSIATPAGDPTEALGSLWYHDHHLDFTAQNVYKGMFGCYNLFDALDSGNENDPNTHALHLPSGDFDIPIFFNDFLFDQNFQTVFDLFDLDGILGDKFCANGAIQPFLNVSKRRYRFRLYNPGPSRWYEFWLFDGTNFLPFWQIATDGNLLPNAVQVSSVRLGVAERADIIVDFSKITASRLYLVNRLEQVNGRGPTGNILTPGTPIIQINLTGGTVSDPSVDPSKGSGGGIIGIPLRPLPDPDFAALQKLAATLKTRTWQFERGGGAWQVNGQFFDPDVVSANPAQESEEVWVIQNPGGSWRHPVHIHFEEHRVLTRDGVPIPQIVPGSNINPQVNGTIDYSRRDVVPLNFNNEVRIFFRFRDMQGRYVMHCHNVVHEDHAMMIRWDIGTPPFS